MQYSISLGLALGCSIAPTSRFARKNYFYPDLAKNYQISQFDEPIAFEGRSRSSCPTARVFTVPIERAHMEEDAGKLTHVGGATGRIQGAEYSLVDYNRAGVPLVEIVTKPIIGAERRRPRARRGLRLDDPRHRARPSASREAPMERGNLRCDANISLRPRGQEKLGTRTETKNVNSFCARSSAPSATRSSVRPRSSPRAARSRRRPATGTKTPARTSAGRPKSDADDYRYFPEPDLLPVEPSARADRRAARRAARGAGRPCAAVSRPSGASPTSSSRTS